MATSDAERKIEAELAQASRARAQGNEGQARVCARRAAGIAIQALFERQGQHAVASSAIDWIELLRERKNLPAEIRQVCEHLLMRVDTEYHLPEPVDLLAETHWLVDQLSRIELPE